MERKRTDSRKQTGKARKGNAGGASAQPAFPGAAGERPFSAVGQVIAPGRVSGAETGTHQGESDCHHRAPGIPALYR